MEDQTQEYIDSLPDVPATDISPYVESLNGWYESLKVDGQIGCNFPPEERLRWAKLARDVHIRGLDLELEDACVAAIYQFCCLAGQMQGTDWSDIFAVAGHFGMQKPRVLLAWKQLQAIVRKYSKR
jgi:hypothetical protein